MKERPILFSGPMVQAILEGRKTQTRRVVKSQPKAPSLGYMAVDGGALQCGPDYPDGDEDFVRCPYGAVGDQLWVREAWRCHEWATDVATIVYRASDYGSYTEKTEQYPVAGKRWIKPSMTWKPSIHMPSWASRIKLEITGVRVERLQDISEVDVLAEGLRKLSKDGGRTWKYGKADRDGEPGNMDFGWSWIDWMTDPKAAFAKAWNKINGTKYPWKSNVWVWVIEFRKL